jgi:beta-xylosidase
MSTLQNLNIYLVLTFLTLINGFNVVFAQSRVEQVKLEHQHIADIGNGLYKNPILAGEYADPTVVRVGKDYYMTHTSYTFQPGLLVWHSQDLINWKPIDHAIQEFDGVISTKVRIRREAKIKASSNPKSRS